MLAISNMYEVGDRENAGRSVELENLKRNLLFHITAYNNLQNFSKVIDIGDSNGQVPLDRWILGVNNL